MKDGRLICMKGGRCIEEMERSSVRRFKKLTDGWGCGGMKKFIRGSHGSIEGLRAPQTKIFGIDKKGGIEMHKPDRLLRLWLKAGKAYRDENGMTGLETAIILIAFVVVASVFAYTVLSAGIFASQESSQVISAGMEQVSSSIAPVGSMMATADAGSGEIDDCDVWVTDDIADCTLQSDLTNNSEGDTAVLFTSLVAVAPAVSPGTEERFGTHYLNETLDLSGDGNTALKMYIHTSDNFASLLGNGNAAVNVTVYLDDDSDPFTDPLETLTFTGADWTTAAEATSAGNLTAAPSASICSVGVGVFVIGDTDSLPADATLMIDNIRPADGTPVIDDCDAIWKTGTGASNTGDASDKKEGTGSAEFTCTAVADAVKIGTHDLSTTGVDLSSNASIQFWVKSSVAISTTGDLKLIVAEDTDCTTVSEALSLTALEAGSWTQQTISLSGTIGNYDLARSIGLRNNSGSAMTTIINIDDIEGPQSMSSIIVTVANAVGADPVDFTNPADADSDGIVDSGSSNTITLTYMDQDQHVNDIQWTSIFMGKDDDDNLLEQYEKVEITVDLTAVDDPVLGTNTSFTIEVRTAIGAPLILERTTPAHLDTVMILD